ncbi:MAG: hypothetical protein LBJ16_03795 [Holosporaceae bacterium]|nr:hypothetical protein [Holosporaceae bacterium]
MVHEYPSTDATQKLPKERMFRKKSIVFLRFVYLGLVIIIMKQCRQSLIHS